MAERPEDLNLPITVVQRIIKESLPDGVIVSKEARQTICRASSVFVLYLTSCAVAHSNKSKRKTLAVNDIMSAIGEMEFDSFIQPLNEILQYRKNNIGQNSKSKPTAASKKDSKAEEEPEEVEEEEIEEQEEINGNEEVEDEVVEENLDEESGRKNKKRKTGVETINAEEEEPNEEKYTESSESEEEEPEERID